MAEMTRVERATTDETVSSSLNAWTEKKKVVQTEVMKRAGMSVTQ